MEKYEITISNSLFNNIEYELVEHSHKYVFYNFWTQAKVEKEFEKSIVFENLRFDISYSKNIDNIEYVYLQDDLKNNIYRLKGRFMGVEL